ncbi:glycosyltransferase family 4 protein [Methylocystis heyeri]|uniref:Glycosyltransferase n=1 Tax=Methylocystis heyeri TaxID=391905 RepID=A0A6B8KDQ5_9HYPH|nr:glycosyltransferase family 1 protein [Methylocystis heyeri]QGM45732.1 glycosyltransferase [Methylocystis heyeri]
MRSENDRLKDYISVVIHAEDREHVVAPPRQTTHPLETAKRFLAQKAKEFYWTATRLVGLGYLHDGSTNLRVWRRALQKFLAAHPSSAATPAPGRRFFIDVTQLLLTERITGIQRVALEVCLSAMRQGGVPVFLHDGHAWACLIAGQPPRPVEIAPGDKLILAGAWWAAPAQTAAVIEAFSQKGGSTVTILFDLFPLLYREICSNVENFVVWFDRIVLASDAVVCISQAVADELIELMSQQKRPFKPGLRLGWQGLGADFSSGADEQPSQQALSISEGKTPFFLGVSTLEPRKGYAIALDAFDKLWREGADASYVIVGREGWLVSALKRRILSHPEYGRRLFWLDNAGDADLRQLYSSAHALVFASIAEGYGLALAEAAHYGLPAIVSDIPVFREIAGDSAAYFQLGDADMLALRLREALAAPKTAPAIPIVSWREATENLLAMIESDAYQYGQLSARL